MLYIKGSSTDFLLLLSLKTDLIKPQRRKNLKKTYNRIFKKINCERFKILRFYPLKSHDILYLDNSSYLKDSLMYLFHINLRPAGSD
jgi:hypothetical protein